LRAARRHWRASRSHRRPSGFALHVFDALAADHALVKAFDEGRQSSHTRAGGIDAIRGESAQFCAHKAVLAGSSQAAGDA
jgi:hypothetical protein